ncbi:MAG: DUF3987 domain-containing protein [Planctomycetota bacterium]
MSTPSPATQRVLAALRAHGQNPVQSVDGWTSCCPAHDDRSPSLSISDGDDGRVLLHCHAGCQTTEVLEALGLHMSDLFRQSEGPHSGRVNETPPQRASGLGFADRNQSAEMQSPEAAIDRFRQLHGSPTTVWRYQDAAGTVVGLIARWDKPDDTKQIRPASRNGAGWALRGMPAPRPLYRLPELAAAPADAPVFVCEGEKAADAVRACGLTATTSPHGSNSARKADWSPLAGRAVVILPDHDDAGEDYAKDAAALAVKAGASSVRIASLIKSWPELPSGGDAADALDLEGGDTDALRAKLERLVDPASPTTQPPVGLPRSPRFEHFPVDAFPEPIRSYITEGARAIGCDTSFLALPMLAGLASAIGNTRRLAIKRLWSEPPILWCAIVGESGTAKSPAMELALRPIHSRQHRAMKQHAEARRSWEVDHARWEIAYDNWKRMARKGDTSDPPQAPECPACARTWIDDATIEALITRLQENPRGLLMVRDELAGWFGFDRYSSGKGGGEVSKWLEVFGGRSLVVDRKTSGTEYVERASVSIIGGIQPATLRRAVVQEHRDNGLVARLLFAMPPRHPKQWTEDDVSERTEAAVARVFEQLYSLEPETDTAGDATPRVLHLSKPAKATWIDFVNRHGAEQADRIGDEASAWAKLEAFCARFALVLHMTRVAADDPTIADPELIDEHSTEAGVRLVEWFAREADRVYALLAGDEKTHQQHQLLEWIEGRGGRISASELSKSKRRFRSKTAEARAELDRLVQDGLGRWEHPTPGSKGGRPTGVFVAGSDLPAPTTDRDLSRLSHEEGSK